MINVLKKNLMFKLSFLIIFVTIITTPIASAKYISSDVFTGGARVASFDVDIYLPNGWEWTKTNEIVFTKPGNITSLNIPFTIVNNSEVAAQCIFIAVEKMLGKRIEFETIYIPAKSEDTYEISLPEDSLIGDTNFKIEMIIEQID